MTLEITPIAAFSDNYIWLVRGADADRAVVVDPGDAGPVLRRLGEASLELAAVMITHHHMDHVGGVRRLLQHWPDIPVYGPQAESIPGMTHALSEGDAVELEALQAGFHVMEVPGHTAGHIAYVGEGALFCGDTLFSVGCGRLFEGTPGQMYASLARLAALPEATRVYCAHEYTLKNIGFALQVEPGNDDLTARQQEAQEQRAAGRPTVPTTIGLERRTNPFLRSDQPQVVSSAQTFAGHALADPVAVFSALRGWRDRA